MYRYQRLLKILLLLTVFFVLNTGINCFSQEIPPVNDKLTIILNGVTPALKSELAGKGLTLGSSLFIRIFKLQGQLEVWLEKNGRYRFFKTYPICSYSGYLGPKMHEGDWQSPEGFYRVTPDQMNPDSDYHLSFNIGYPNDYDTLLRRNGSSIMVHGSCSSKGCFAMKNYRMEEIYTLAHFAFLDGQQAFDIHIFPFPMSDENLHKFRFSPWIGFWKNLQEGYAAFEQSHMVPFITAEKGKYIIDRSVKLAMSKKQQ